MTQAARDSHQLKIVIVGHVDHGKSTLVGRLIHETGSLPEGRFTLEKLADVSAEQELQILLSCLMMTLVERSRG